MKENKKAYKIREDYNLKNDCIKEIEIKLDESSDTTNSTMEDVIKDSYFFSKDISSISTYITDFSIYSVPIYIHEKLKLLEIEMIRQEGSPPVLLNYKLLDFEPNEVLEKIEQLYKETNTPNVLLNIDKDFLNKLP